MLKELKFPEREISLNLMYIVLKLKKIHKKC